MTNNKFHRKYKLQSAYLKKVLGVGAPYCSPKLELKKEIKSKNYCNPT